MAFITANTSDIIYNIMYFGDSSALSSALENGLVDDSGLEDLIDKASLSGSAELISLLLTYTKNSVQYRKTSEE